MKANGRIILASMSPRRREFLELLGLKAEVISSGVEENGRSGDPGTLAQRMAGEKVKTVRRRLGKKFEGWVLGADTVVALGREIFGKPSDAEDARRMLRRLAGRTHQVWTGFRVERSDGDFREGTVKTDVDFAPLRETEIEAYIQSGEPFDKAGAYAIQGRAGVFVREIRGSFSNVVGLPLAEVVSVLRELGAVTD